MRNRINITMLIAALLLGFVACQKVEDLPFYKEGNAVNLSSDKTAVSPTAADSNNYVLNLTWTAPNYATDTANWKFVLEVDTADNNFADATRIIVSGVLKYSITGKELNAILLNYGFNLGETYGVDTRIISSYANNNEQYFSNVVKINVTPYNDPSVLTSDVSSVTLSLANAGDRAITFNWTRSFNGYTGNVTYVLQYDSATRNFANLKEVELGTNLLTSNLTQEEINNSAIDVGIPMGNLGTVQYRLKATTAQGATSYSNAVSVSVQSYVSILRYYLPGGYQGSTNQGNDWSPETAPEFIRDLRSGLLNNLYYLYIWLPANAQFKVTQGRSWDINYGGSGGNLEQNSGTNLSVSAAGYYRISIDRRNMTYDIREGRMGFVGGGTGAGWSPESVFPNYRMGLAATNLFVGLTNLTTDQWKMIDNDAWNNGSNTISETRSYGTSEGSGSSPEVNGGNFNAPGSAGRYRVIWDGRDRDNIKYEMSPATEMRVVGNGIDGVPDWSPGASPQMTYSGNGVWTITLDLKANQSIKFLAGNDWGAFDYEDQSGTADLGVDRRISWSSGGSDFKTPTVAGNYTITLNEYTQTVRID